MKWSELMLTLIIIMLFSILLVLDACFHELTKIANAVGH